MAKNKNGGGGKLLGRFHRSNNEAMSYSHNNSTSGASFDSSAQAYFTLLDGMGGAPLSASVKTAVNVWVITAKADGSWASMDEFYLNLGDTLAKRAVSIKSLASRTFINTPTVEANNFGTTYNGVSNYARCPAPADAYTGIQVGTGWMILYFSSGFSPTGVNALTAGCRTSNDVNRFELTTTGVG